eukprot:scaffold392_cov177-Amphora_coffeaeformis.AAC.8
MSSGLMEIQVIATTKDLLAVQALIPIRILTLGVSPCKSSCRKACFVLTGNDAGICRYDCRMEFMVFANVQMWQQRTK